MKVEIYTEGLLDRKALRQRYAKASTTKKELSGLTLRRWIAISGATAPTKAGAPFTDRAIRRLDLYYIATYYRKLTASEYERDVIPAGGLNKFLLKNHRITLLEFLEHLPEEAQQDDPVVISLMRSLKAEEEAQKRQQQEKTIYVNFAY